ncbi:hypothetical protein [Caulobacter hibisci]|uniref:Uncharacterized protein n=1 Tax=Caulobacter hibisci TaxID=2035993 RepID=A0ABS0T1X9_9CAUL|nr:hypothetical protein [Caulobacter hibisci]MBI1684877.1 hypothetical protein [Caulobacter hibisci]
MESRRKAGPTPARLDQLSRRAVMAGGATAPLTATLQAPAAKPDPAVMLCQRWLAVDAEQRRLMTEWGQLEGWLIRKMQWHRLSPDERAAIPEGQKLAQIDARLDVLQVERLALLKSMRPKPAASVEAVIANLMVASCLIFEDDEPEAHGLITRAARDLTAFCGK